MSSQYPLPLVILKFLSKITYIGLPRLFTLAISGFFFFSTLAVFLLGRKVTGSTIGGFIAAALFSVGVWTTDGLRMGLLAESFGWGMLAVTLYFLAENKLVWTVIFSGLLIISHPIAFFVYLVCLLLYLGAGLIQGGTERRFCLKLMGVYVVLSLILIFAKPSLIQHFLQFSNPENLGWGLQKLGDILTTGGVQRLGVSFFAAIGLVIAAKNWSRPENKVVIILLFAGLFMSLSQIFGISFLVFRFFPYLEMSVVLLAAIGILVTVENLGLKNKTANVLLPFCLAIPMVLYNLSGTNTITRYQTTVATANARMTVGDQLAIDWIASSVPPGSFVDAPIKRSLWISALTPSTGYFEPALYNEASVKSYWLAGNGMPLYIYFSELEQTPASLLDLYDKVYDKDGVRIYKFKR